MDVFMKVAIMGAGAMGCMFGAKMTLSGQEVWLIDGWKEHVERMRQMGLAMERDGVVENIPVNACLEVQEALEQMGEYPGLVIIFCKGVETEAVTKKAIPLIGPKTLVLTLQNGIGNADMIARYVPKEQILFGAASAAAVLNGPGSIRDNTSKRPNLIDIMPMNGVITEECEAVAEMITKAGMGTTATLETEKFIWTKLSLNCCVNAIATLTRLANVYTSNDPNGFILFNKIVAEVVAVAQAKGIDVEYEQVRSFVHLALHKQNHYPSMLQDARNKRPLEIDTMNGAVVQEGKRLGIPTPVNETLTLLVKLLAGNYEHIWY